MAIDPNLSVREREVCDGICRGLSKKQIASELDLSPHTVKFHAARIYRKLGAKTAAHAAVIFTVMEQAKMRADETGTPREDERPDPRLLPG